MGKNSTHFCPTRKFFPIPKIPKSQNKNPNFPNYPNRGNPNPQIPQPTLKVSPTNAMSKARHRSTKKSIQNPGLPLPPSSIPQAPVFYPTEAEFQDPLAYISQIRPEAERFGICRIVPPKSWAPPFALDRSNFTFPTKSQSIHQLQARAPSCDSKTFNLEHGRFLEKELGKKAKKKVVFEGAELDLCKMFYAVKRFGGYKKVCEGKKWGEVLRFVRPEVKISECGKHVLCQLYREFLFEYEEYQGKKSKRERQENESEEKLGSKKRRKSGVSEDTVKEEVKEELDQICEQCKSGLHGEVMLLCDRCDKGWHLYCLTPPLESVPSGNWYCLECVNSEKDSFGFVPGKTYSLEAFRRRDERAKRKWLGQTCVTRAQIEKKFWEIVEGRAGDVEVMYGSDLDTSIHGSGFPRCGDAVPSSIDLDLWNEYCSNPWNLNNLPKLQGSMLKAVHDNIAGVMVPWLYIGMLFSSFCWHVEDHCFYSINYLHWGEPKCWYGVPGIEAGAFEQVMRDNLPDLFDAQPDLLFQLVTMLNPSVLQENGVSVYNVMQEPGNFVVTFPKSFHGGFNFGLNCAEAVNFAPADWLPHGGFGAEWYRLYHKAQVLSHEELLCVVSQSGCDAKALPYLKDEMHRIYVGEKKYREELWRCGIVRSSRMPPRKQPMYVGTEEDPTCVICQQYLYLSAITCTCRPSAFVCLEHWQHLCECKPSKLRLLYRQTLAELYDLVHLGTKISEATSTAESQCCINSQRRFHYKVTDMTRKVKGDLISYTQLAEDWLSKACHLIEVPFSNIAYKKSLQEAEQFLWASHDMDLVREMANKLVDAQQWAIKLRNVLSKVEECFLHKSNDANKVSLCSIEELLVDPLPCNEPGHVKLKAFAEDARTLVCEIKSVAESIDLEMLERLYYRTVKFPIKLKESVELETEISSAKSWITDASKCLSKEKPTVDIDFLDRVKLKMAELHVQVPYMDAITNLCHEVDLWQSQCKEILKRPIKIKELEDFIGNADNISITIPEMELLKQYYFDAYTWICNVKNTMFNLKTREDHHNVVEELRSILDSGNLLRVQVDELPVIEAELSRFRCREKALKAVSTHELLDILEQLSVEASSLEIQNEQLFLEVHKVITAAKSWEEKAKSLLETAAPRSEYEELLRSSENIPTYLPSLSEIKNALTQAQAWISKSEPYLTANPDSLHHLLDMDDLKELVTQSEHLKVTLDGTQKLKCILNDVNRWDDCANSLLEQSKALLYMDGSDTIIDSLLSVKVTALLNKIGSAIERGLAFCLQLNQLPELDHASLILKWSLKALSFCSEIPLYEEVVSLLKDANNLPNTFLHNTLTEALNMGLIWLQKAMSMFPVSQISKRCKQEDVEEILEESKKAVISYPKLVAQLETAIVNHESWAREVNSFFSKCSGQSWASLKKLKELGQFVAFDCNELDKILYETEKVDKWMILCHRILEPFTCEIKSSLDKALCIYRSSSGFKRSFCVCCPNDSEDDSYICLTCEDRYHFSCMGPPLAAAGMTNEYACPFCLCMESGAISGPTGNALISRGKRPELKSFVQLLSSRKDCYEDVEEVSFVQDIVKIALECKSCLTEIVNRALVHSEKDLSYVSESLLRALKAVAVMGVYDVEDGCFLESAVSKNSWKIRVKGLLEESKKPSLSLIHRLLKEGISIGIPSTDHYMKEIMEVKQICLLWLETAKKAITESEALELHDIFKLISDGESLPVLFAKEIELLRDRSILYCICRKPYDHRAMIACDQCDEWYHFDCIKLDLPTPDKFLCAACKPSDGEFVALPVSFNHEERRSNDGEPHTPPACHKESNRRQPKKAKYSLDQKMDTEVLDLRSILKCYSEIDLLWRGNRRPLKRTVRKLTKFEKLSQFLHFPQSH